MKTDWVSMQVRCVLGHCSFRGLGCPRKEQLGESGTWRGSVSCGRKKSRMFAQTMSRTGCNLLSGSFQRWLVTVGSPVPAAAAGKVLREGNSQRLGRSWEGTGGVLQGEGNAFFGITSQESPWWMARSSAVAGGVSPGRRGTERNCHA